MATSGAPSWAHASEAEAKWGGRCVRTGRSQAGPVLTPHQRTEAIRAVALFEAAKGAVVLLAGFGVLSLIHRDAQHVADVIVRHLHLNPARHYPQIFLHAAERMTDRTLWMLVAGALGYCAVRFVEAYGLWRQRWWAEGFAALSGAIYMPFEIYRLLHGGRLVPAIAFALNTLVVAFMVYALWMRRREAAAALRRLGER
jgi:uncharacterized membrane protein (DUF2068 family)